VRNADGTNQHAVLALPDFSNERPGFSPDGTQVVFSHVGRITTMRSECASLGSRFTHNASGRRIGRTRSLLTGCARDSMPDLPIAEPGTSPDVPALRSCAGRISSHNHYSRCRVAVATHRSPARRQSGRLREPTTQDSQAQAARDCEIRAKDIMGGLCHEYWLKQRVA
jgi:hypothetical protein